jgi:alkylmercury lyase
MTEPGPQEEPHHAQDTSSLSGRADALIDALEAGLPRLDDIGRSVVLELYRALAHGRPVSNVNLRKRTGYPVDDLTDAVHSWRDVVYDDEDNIIGFWGLTIQPTAHSFETEAAHLYTWCAWDTLFLPAILDVTARVSSTDPQSGQPVTLTVTPAGIARRSHPDIVVSFVVPNGDACAADVRTGFCQHVHFFTDQHTAQRWLAGHRDLFTLDLDAAYELGRRRNRARGLT